MSDAKYPVLKLKKNEDRRIRNGHLWVYSNEIDTTATPLKDYEPGQMCLLTDSADKALGYAYINPGTLIAARLIKRGTDGEPSRSYLKKKFRSALALREQLYAEPCYRLIFGEADGLPGLVVDRFYDILVVQLTTAGMEAMKQDVLEMLDAVFEPVTILLRNDASSRKAEGLDLYVETVKGNVAELARLSENGVLFDALITQGQKTGWFYDQAMNRQRFMQYAKGKRVLDVFSYIGGWGVSAAVAGATDVYCVDASEKALDAVHHNAGLNNVADIVATIQGDAFEVLKNLRAENEKFDLIVVDPPAFIKKKKDYKAGSQAYKRINQMAMQLLNPDGILVSCSCSHHMPRADLVRMANEAARHVDRSMQIIEWGGQGPDHPINPVMPETEYLKAVFSRIQRI
ncbi:MAG: class I SAM-dependent rRNA methyltransferase [Gammaproteobacteria bacterium]|nr:class I SAM-dependent rRNA methyltransferase [Gammaproteobacteria bacterium]